MASVIPVKFTYAARDLWFDPGTTGAQEGDHLICSTERGTEIGLATADAREVTNEELASTIGSAQLRCVVRIATEADLERADELARRGEDSMSTFRRHVAASGLDMKPVGVEYLFDGEKAVCYFAAEERVDFRQLVRDLSRELRVRIDMRQIGVREEAAIVGGYGHCGQELCCRRFATGFDPVSIRMAKEQDLPLNSTKISGACGRLMCCLRYEFEAYRDFKGRAPKKNAVIDTPLGKAKIIEYDTPKEQLVLRLEGGKQVRVALADMSASEAAHKKSEELGCPCRPDTVTREVLDRMESPDVQMALAELDRKMGVLAEPKVDAADIFVEPKRKRRRATAGAPSAEKGAAAAPVAPADEEGSGAPRRRKRRMSDGAEARAAQDEGAPAAQQGTRRRRHHQGAEGAAGEGIREGEVAPRRRRPGDKGGQAGAPSAPRGMQPSRKRRAQQGGEKGGQQPSVDSGSEGAAKRRRRRRGGRGRGGAAEGGAPASE